MSFAYKKAALSFFLHLSLPLLLSGPLFASGITIEPQIGFHGLFQLGHPFPIRLEITNIGRPVEGTLEVRVWKGGPLKGAEAYPIYYRRQVFLSAQSQKSVQFTIDPGSMSRPLVVNFSTPRGNVSKEIDLRRHFSPSPLILLLTGNSVLPPAFLSSDSTSPLISMSVGHLPPVGRAYRGVSTIIFYEQSLRDLSKPQTMALERWLLSGGRMLVLGSIHYALYQEPAMRRFLPVRVTGLKKVSSLPSFERVYQGGDSSLRNIWVQDSSFVEGRMLIEEKGTPILVELNRGRGKIIYLSLDVGRPPMSRWEGLSLLYNDLLGSHVKRGNMLQTSWTESVFSRLLSEPSFISGYVPVRPLFLWLLLYLGGLGLLAWLWRRERLSGRALILSFFSMVVLFSFGGYLYFSWGRNIPDGILVSSTLLEEIPDGYVEVQSNVALFSTLRGQYNLKVKRGWTDLEPVFARQETPGGKDIVVQEEGNTTRIRFPLREWNFRLFKIRSIGHFPIRTEVQKQGHKLFLRLTNLTAKDLTECWLVISGQQFFLGDIRPGSSEIREFPLAPEGPLTTDGESDQADKKDLRDIPFKDRMREILFRHSFFPEKQGVGRWADGNVIFFGWVKEAPRRVWVDDARILAYHHTLFRAIIPLDEEEI